MKRAGRLNGAGGAPDTAAVFVICGRGNERF
jgi:hypothetical protein